MPDTPYSFLVSPAISSLAKTASLPQGYTPSFTNLHASITGDSYLGYILLDSYKTTQCSTSCNVKDQCCGFNIFVERSPTMRLGPKCPSPSSTSLISARFGEVLRQLWRKNALNSGYMGYRFAVAIAGSNGYVKETSKGLLETTGSETRATRKGRFELFGDREWKLQCGLDFPSAIEPVAPLSRFVLLRYMSTAVL
jgi:hypothetical protein